MMCKPKVKISAFRKELTTVVLFILTAIESPFLLNQRQYNLIIGLEKKLQTIVCTLNDQVAYELISYHLKEALEKFAEFSGKTIDKKSLDVIFKKFCIGK
jgi:tRNA U34 5-carboxymethylaminomethyl modifying GTPase MnmE/TrmE